MMALLFPLALALLGVASRYCVPNVCLREELRWGIWVGG